MGIGLNLQVTVRMGLMAALALSLTACDEEAFQGFNFGKTQSDDQTVTPAPSAGSIKLVERDVEAPEAFDITTKALWDGRPSLGGIWVAHPDTKQPERVIIRNKANGKFVIGALFRRERHNPGPALQLSSDAASALGVLAGTPTELSVTALRRETVNVAEKQTAEEAVEEPAKQTAKQAPVEQPTIRPVKRPARRPAKQPTEQPTEQPASTEAVATSELDPLSTEELEKWVIESIKKAERKETGGKPAEILDRTGQTLRADRLLQCRSERTSGCQKDKKAGIPAKMVKSTTDGKTSWRVIAGPAGSVSAREELLTMVKNQGIDDAYFVAN